MMMPMVAMAVPMMITVSMMAMLMIMAVVIVLGRGIMRRMPMVMVLDRGWIIGSAKHERRELYRHAGHGRGRGMPPMRCRGKSHHASVSQDLRRYAQCKPSRHR